MNGLVGRHLCRKYYYYILYTAYDNGVPLITFDFRRQRYSGGY